MKNIITLVLLLTALPCFSQIPVDKAGEDWKTIYRSVPLKINDLVNTKLEVSFDFDRSWMYGKASITLKPHFYPTDSLTLDAKGMAINEVSIVKDGKHVSLKYSYDSLNLRITLDKTYRGGEKYTIFIDYVARPDEIKSKGSPAITDSKGLYFINPQGTDKNKPMQIWTQGETESNSVWVPTIDKPNQKTTSEISITAPARFTTLSNGLLVKRKVNSNGTRTDTWLMDLPQAPYLMMMAIGEYTVIKDAYNGKEVSYYVEKQYASVARKIFGLTPEMMSFFSKATGIEYPWQKYSQVVVRDYISGAMENTTATVHGEAAEQDARQLVDGNSWEDVIAHELFHMWFGDLVTTKSWSNLTINESFADFSETLWEEHKHGKDAGDEHNFNSMQTYLLSNSGKKDLVRFYYRNREDMFDAVSYQKGGRILNMLRNYVGDTAFFKSVNLFLSTYKFKAAGAQELRLAFEEITGQDLNWFWNQWYFGSGHPNLDISYDYDQKARTAKVIVKQKQAGKIFILPVAIDLYRDGGKTSYKVWLHQKADTFAFPSEKRPELINFDGNKILLCEKSDHKTIDEYIFQYKHAGLYLDRREAIDFAAKCQEDDPKAMELLKNALNDSYQGLIIYAIEKLNLNNDSVRISVESILEDQAKNNSVPKVRAAAIAALGKYKKDKFKELYLTSLNDSSYSVAGSALVALGYIDSATALTKARELSTQQVKGELSQAISNLLFKYAGESEFDSLANQFDSLPWGNDKFMLLQPFADFLKRVDDPANFKKGIDMIVRFRDSTPESYMLHMGSYFNGMILNGIATAKQKEGMSDLAEYVKSKFTVKPKAKLIPVIDKETLKKYAGEYEYNDEIIKVSLKNKSLSISFPDQSDLELTPLSTTKFEVKLLEGYTVEFITGNNNEVTSLLFGTDQEEIKALKK